MPNVLVPLFSLLLAISAGHSVVRPDVASVVSGGYWITQGQAGTYRVVVINSGFEHVSSRVFVEWVAEPKSAKDEPTVVAVVEPALPFGQGVASLHAALKPLASGRVQIMLSGVISSYPEQKVSAVVTATNPGQVTTSGG
jgi:hypothetical protein